MEVILLEHVEKLGKMGDKVNVKNGYARNYLLPNNKALRATEVNVAYFEKQKAELEARNQALFEAASENFIFIICGEYVFILRVISPFMLERTTANFSAKSPYS